MVDDTGESKGKRIIKPTLSAVLHAQEQLRKHISMLIKENRPIANEKERALFLREWNYATLGFGKDYDVEYSIQGIDGPADRHGTDYFARVMSMRANKEKEYHQRGDLMRPANDVIVPISFHWKALLSGAFEVFPYAIDRASSMSKEQETTSRTKGFKVE